MQIQQSQCVDAAEKLIERSLVLYRDELPQLQYAPRLSPWRDFQIAVSRQQSIPIPTTLIQLKSSQHVFCEAYRMACRYFLPVLKDLFVIQGKSLIIQCHNSRAIQFSQFYSPLQQITRVQVLLEDPYQNWYQLLHYVFSQGVKSHFQSIKGSVEHSPQTFKNIIEYILRTDKSSQFHLKYSLFFFPQLPSNVEFHRIITRTRSLVTFAVLGINNRCHLIERNVQTLPYYLQATQIYNGNRLTRQFALNSVSVIYFYSAQLTSPLRTIQDIFVDHRLTIMMSKDTEESMKILQITDVRPRQSVAREPNLHVQVSPKKLRSFLKNKKQQYRFFYSLFQDAFLHDKFQVMMLALGQMEANDLHWPFLQQGHLYPIQQFAGSIITCYNLIFKKAGIRKIEQIFRLHLPNQTLTCHFHKYSPQTKSFRPTPLSLKIQEYFNVHTKDINLPAIPQHDMGKVFNFINKRMVIEAVQYSLPENRAGLEIRDIFSLFKGQEYSSFTVRIKSINDPTDKKAIIDLLLKNYHFHDNPEILFKLFSIHHDIQAGMFTDDCQWHFSEKQQPQDINYTALPSNFGLIVHNINQTVQCTRLKQYAQKFRQQIQTKYPRMNVSQITYQRNSFYNIELNIRLGENID